jgi:hypothetical protein
VHRPDVKLDFFFKTVNFILTTSLQMSHTGNNSGLQLSGGIAHSRFMNTVLETNEVTVTDNRLARCQHPRLRQALMFHPPRPLTHNVRPATAPKRVSVPSLNLKAGGQKAVKSVTSFVAITFVKVMSFMFDGIHFVTAPL